MHREAGFCVVDDISGLGESSGPSTPHEFRYAKFMLRSGGQKEFSHKF